MDYIYSQDMRIPLYNCKICDGPMNHISETKDFKLFQCIYCNHTLAIKKEINSMYIVVKDPYNEGGHFTGKKVYDSLDQAITVAKKLAVENPVCKYYVAKLIKSAKLEPNVTVEDL